MAVMLAERHQLKQMEVGKVCLYSYVHIEYNCAGIKRKATRRDGDMKEVV